MKPKLPGEAFEPAPVKRGFHSVPKKNSAGEIREKKSTVSKSIEKTIPTVVRMAIDEATISAPRTTPSTLLRALRRGLICL